MIFTIADLHLPLGIDKPMNIFGPRWDNYVQRIENNWQSLVRDEDTVVIPGDVSWATYIEQARADFEFINRLNGRKIIVKGNHDYWWTTMSQMNIFLKENGFDSISILHNNSFAADGVSICGTRGWHYPSLPDFTVSDEKYFKREIGRLEMSLKSAATDEIYVFTHYPPMSAAGEGNEFCDMMKKYNVKKCFYGHLHSYSHNKRIPHIVDGIEYQLISADFLEFVPRLANK